MPSWNRWKLQAQAPTWALRKSRPGTTKLDMAILGVEAKRALVGLGWKATIAQAAVAAAAANVSGGVTLEKLIMEALQRCPKPVVGDDAVGGA